MSEPDGFDVCVIGSGAGGGPVAAVVAEAGYRVVLLEKGPWYTRKDFKKDEVLTDRRQMFIPDRRREPHVWEKDLPEGREAWLTTTGWNGSLVGGATNLMSGFFQRMKPIDFRLRSEFGPVEGSTVVDWPIAYEDLVPYYDRVEREIGVSGRVVDHPWADERTGPFPYPAMKENPLSRVLDETCAEMGLHSVPLPRAVLPRRDGPRNRCNQSGYCASYGCTTGAKGSSRETVIPRALDTGRLDLRFGAHVTRILCDSKGRAEAAEYVGDDGRRQYVRAGIFVVACQAIETARLLLNSAGPRHPNGLGNGNGMVGKNLIFSTYGAGWGDFPYETFERRWPWMRDRRWPFVNRTLQDYYVIDDPRLGRRKGGTLDFLRMHPNPIQASVNESLYAEPPAWGWDLKKRLVRYFRETIHLRFEVFGDYTPIPEGEVVLDPGVRDVYGMPVARARVHRHPRDLETAEWLTARGREILEHMGAENLQSPVVGTESTNLQAGTCRFGADPETSVLDPDCRSHEVENLFVSDASCMPTGGSIPFTFTVYANAFRVAERIVEQLGGAR